LREPAAFPAWLRTLVIKHCDRVTRRPRPRLASLEFAFDVPAAILDPDAEVAGGRAAEWLRLAVKVCRRRSGSSWRCTISPTHRDPHSRFSSNYRSRPSRNDLRPRPGATARKKEDRLMQNTIDTLRPSRTGEFADEVSFFIALRAGDGRAWPTCYVANIPELAHAQQQWAPSWSMKACWPFASRATALLDRDRTRRSRKCRTLLLDAGADVDGVCGCATAESPVWAAALLNRIEHRAICCDAVRIRTSSLHLQHAVVTLRRCAVTATWRRN
jgi:hypothetical protein